MSRISRCIFRLGLIGVYLTLGCGNGSDPVPANSFRAVVFSDFHFTPFYDPSLFPALVTADPSQWEAIFKTSTMTAPARPGADTNYPLLVLALSSIKQNAAGTPVIIYTGDLIGHSFASIFFGLNGNSNPQDPAAIAALQSFANKTVSFVTAQVRSAAGNIPVVFAMGNIDSYIGYGPDSTFLSDNAEAYYTEFLNSIANRQTFMNSFTSGGYYSAEIGTKLLVIGLNTTPMSPLIPVNKSPSNNDSAVFTQLGWLDATLASAQAAGQKVWLLMHVPPGADVGTTLTTPSSFDGSGQLVTAAMMWVPAYQAAFLQIISKYPGMITLILAAHTHMNEFRILSPTNVVTQAPAICPCLGNNPAYEIFTFTNDTFAPTDYRSLNYDLAALPAQFNNYYIFSTVYSLPGPLGASLAQLYPELSSSIANQAFYRGQFDSGNQTLQPGTTTPWNYINDANWPVFRCGIGNAEQQDFTNCVNSH